MILFYFFYRAENSFAYSIKPSDFYTDESDFIINLFFYKNYLTEVSRIFCQF